MATSQEWVARLGVTPDAIQRCLSLPSREESAAALDELKATAKRLYRQYVRAVHPDFGGSPDELCALNEAKGLIEGLGVPAPIQLPAAEPPPSYTVQPPPSAAAAPRSGPAVLGHWIRFD